MYFDSVLDRNMMSIFKGTREETTQHVSANRKFFEEFIGGPVSVWVGEEAKLLSIEEYLDLK